MLRRSVNASAVKIKIKVIEKINAIIRRSVKLIQRYNVSPAFLIECNTADSPVKDFLMR